MFFHIVAAVRATFRVLAMVFAVLSMAIPTVAAQQADDLRPILITGATSGIGLRMTEVLSQNGFFIYAGARKREDMERLNAMDNVQSVRLDVTIQSDIDAAVQLIEAEGRGLYGLINNAGGMVAREKYEDWTEQLYDSVMDLNARSVLAASKAAIPHLKQQGAGFIINTTSIAARNGAGPGAGLYGSSKSVVANVTRGMAKELTGANIRVNAVAPGIIDTPFHERYSTKAQLDAMIATIPMGRAATADECVGAYLFLASATLSGYVTGQSLEINGGQMML